PKNHLIDEADVDQIEEANIQSIKIRSVLTCEAANGVCGACYGRDLARGTPVNMGEAVGVIAAQSIGEPGTQLTMRTFHIGGTAQVVDSSFIESNHAGTVKIVNRNVVKDSNGQLVVMGRNVQVVVVDEHGNERASHKLTYGSRLKVDEGGSIARGQRIAEWDPYTMPILTEVNGTVEFEDLVDGVSIREVADEATGISSRVVVDWRASPRGSELRPAMVIKGKDGKVLKLASGNDARYLLSVDAILSVENGADVHAGDVLARIPTEGAKTRDITGGLPRVAELFEARRPKDHAIIAEVTGRVEFGRDYKNKRRIIVHPLDESLEPIEYLIPKGKHISVQEGDIIEKGEFLLDGHPAPHDILAISGVEELAAYLVNEVQDVYRLQGVSINDKHIEVIVRNMLQKVEVTNPGDSITLPGEQLDRMEFDEMNAKLVAQGKTPATATPVLLGITKASLQTRSFISAASFQETTRVLTEAAVSGKVDQLIGLKENVIVGRLIPAGTGGMLQRLRGEAKRRDEKALADQGGEPVAASAEIAEQAEGAA
ncbi:MAG: DNA-directed RNA polymerase subunit beta', partial [Parvibaculum sp.]